MVGWCLRDGADRWPASAESRAWIAWTWRAGARASPTGYALPVNERARFRQRLGRGPLLADGGMGTLLFSRGVPQRTCLDELATTRPDLIGAIHREYLEAGADLIETATFGANRLRLGAHGLAHRAHAFNRRAAQVAREARDVSGRDVLVGGSIGPLGAATRELASHDEGAVRAVFREQIEGLLEGGVDLFVIESFWDLGHLRLAIDEARRAADLPILAEMTFGEELVAADGTTPEAAAATLTAAGVDAIGVNCGAGPFACLEAVERIGRAAPTAARSVMPNAGLPQRIEGRFVYAAEPEYFGAIVPKALATGATILGGCCGTTPEHIAAMRAALDAIGALDEERARARTEPAARPSAAATAVAPTAAPTAGTHDRTVGEAPPATRLATALAEGRFVVSVEIDPPRSIRIDRTLDAARLLRDAGVDLVNVSDSAMARVRMGCMAVAFGIQHDLDLECLVHLTTRDRNLMALESELLGAHALGVRNILALTGDPPRIGDYPTGTGVWDVDSIGLIEILGRLNRGEDGAGSPIGQRAGFTIACALDPTAVDRATEWDRLERKLGAGGHLVMTQPLFSLEQVEAMDSEAHRRFGSGGFPVPVLLGILPLQSSRHAEFLHHEVPGITIPDDARAAMAAAGDRGAEVGLEMALALLEQARGFVAGTYVMPSFGRYEQAAELTRRIRAHEARRAGAGTHRGE
jgi:methionine synthase I (cobalamin-dependent)/5,10-methylenetetrahydrofolate reductase